MKKAGDEFHNFVATLEKMACENKYIKIESHKYVLDKTSGAKREHDILLHYDDGHQSFKVALECKDLKRPVGQPIVEGFSTKLKDTGIHKGVIVSSSGFCKTALLKAKQHNIECWSLQEATAFDWCLTKELKRFNHKLVSGYLQVVLKDNYEGEFSLFEENSAGDIEIDKEKNLKKFMRRLFNGIEKTMVEGIKSIKVNVKNVADFYCLSDEGKRLEIEGLVFTGKYKTDISHSPFVFHSYNDDSLDENKMQIATAIIEKKAGLQSQLLFKRNNKNIEIHLVVNKE
tara:strand:- start:225 stop:1082 length:858 start_codon:yes stop_codon:yes gene_type:complete